MDKRSGWLNGDFTDWISRLAMFESPRYCGLFVVKWEAEELKPRPNTPASESFSACMRIERLLRVSAMRFAKDTGAVLGWTQAGTTLIVAVSASAEESEAAQTEIGKLTYGLRESISHSFSRAGAAPESIRGVRSGQIRHGFGWITRMDEAHLRSREQICARVVRAAEAAIGRMFRKEMPPLRFGFHGDLLSGSGRTFLSAEARYSPIVSLLDGSLYGFEALPFDPNSGARMDLSMFYGEAFQQGKLFESDRAFREAAIRGLPSRNGDVKLFLPVPAAVVYDSRLYTGSTLRRIESAGLRPEHVVLVLVGGEEENGAALKSALGHYRMQGFRIALSGITASRSDLLRMIALQPDYALLNVSEVGAYSPNPVEESLLHAMTALARKEQIVLIAQGVDREEALPLLVASGMSYGQGAWIGGEQTHAGQAAVSPQVQSRIRSEVQRRYRGATGSLSQLAIPVVQFARSTPVSEIARHFELHRETQAIVITGDELQPVGLIMKEKLHQMLSGQFGLALYWSRPVGKIMDAHPMIVDEAVPIDQVSQMAMAREPDKLYDAVIVTRSGVVMGIVFIRAMLEWVTRTRVEFAQWANPLTGLPGNVPIQRELSRRLAEGKSFSIWYADLDHFKWYNDQYGFHSGDEVIRYTAEVLSEAVRDHEPTEGGDSFIGHVGGDDFIVFTGYSDPVAAAKQTLKRFERGIGAFIGKKTGVISDRYGQTVEGAELSLSLSLLLFDSSQGWTPETVSERSAHLKKKAKRMSGNSLVWEVADLAYAEWSVT